MSGRVILTWDEGLRLKSLPPSRRDVNVLLRLVLGVSWVTLVFSMLNQCWGVLRIEGHHDIPEVSSVNLPAFRKLVRHIAAELWILNHGRPKVLDTELIVLGNVDPLDINHVEKALLFFQDWLKEVFVKTDLWRTIELTKMRVSFRVSILTVVLWNTSGNLSYIWTCRLVQKDGACCLRLNQRQATVVVAITFFNYRLFYVSKS